MVLAYHSIFSTRGFWLPNDPRGSWSDYVRCYELYAFGPATKTSQRRSLAKDEHNQRLRKDAKLALKYGEVKFSGVQALTVSEGFARAAAESIYVLFACAIMPDHVHLVVQRHAERLIERIVGYLKTRATQALIEKQIHPLQEHRRADGFLPTCWVQHGWNVYLNSQSDILRAIDYVKANPRRAGLRDQKWSFVTDFLR
jgi:REP element-mobilizing transposase RayT